jgi:hypothetical protein
MADGSHGLLRYVNPRSDERFVRTVELIIASSVDGPSDLEARLRVAYPDAIVRERDLDHEPPAWYVYRDGHWVPD